MDLYEYFAAHKGAGVLATADSAGKVDTAIYARPHVIDARTIAFVMADRLTRHNLQSNPHASYLFVECGSDYAGCRLSLTRVREETDAEKIRTYLADMPPECGMDETTIVYVVYFSVTDARPLVGESAPVEEALVEP